MRHSTVHKVGMRPVTGRRIAAAKRFLQKERDKAPLFAAEIEAEQPTPEERIQKHDAGFVAFWQEFRNHDARVWRKARALLRTLPADAQAEIHARWQASSIPGNAAYFSDFLRTRLVEWAKLIGLEVLPCHLNEQHIAQVVAAKPWIEHPWSPWHVLELSGDGMWRDTKRAFRTLPQAESFASANIQGQWRAVAF